MTNGAQKIRFTFKEPGWGRIGLCSVETRALEHDKLMVIFSDEGDAGCGRIEESIASIATQFKNKHLRSMDPDVVIWVIHVSAGSIQDETYQKVRLAWDGERYDIPRQMARLNRNAFLSAVGDRF